MGEQHPPTQGCPGLSLSQAPEAWGLGEQGHESPGLAPQGVWPGRPWASSSAPLEPSGPSLLGRRRLALGPDSIPCSAFEEEQKRRAGVREESPARAAQEGVRPEQGLFTTGQEFPMVLSPGYTGQVVRRRVLSS